MSVLRIISWNVNGIRAGIKKGFWEKIEGLKADIICIQETKTDTIEMAKLAKSHELIQAETEDLFEINSSSKSSWKILWHSAENRKGYSGVATLWKETDTFSLINKQIGILDEEFDLEGRMLLSEFKFGMTEFCILNAYYPQGGRGPHRIDYKIRFYIKVRDMVEKLLLEGKNVILCGDFNTTITDQDLARPEPNRKTTGCLPEERLALNWLIDGKFFDEKQLQIKDPEFQKYADLNLQSLNLIDVFRQFYPDLKDKYTYWDQITRARERNVGWRIDYFIANKELLNKIKSVEILDQVFGSDHAPVLLELEG